MTPAEITQLVAIILGPSGAVFASLKIILNGTKGRVDKIEQHMENMDEKIDRVVEDLAYLKGKESARQP